MTELAVAAMLSVRATSIVFPEFVRMHVKLTIQIHAQIPDILHVKPTMPVSIILAYAIHLLVLQDMNVREVILTARTIHRIQVCANQLLVHQTLTVNIAKAV